MFVYCLCGAKACLGRGERSMDVVHFNVNVVVMCVYMEVCGQLVM